MSDKTLIGKVIHVFPKINVAVVRLESALKAGDTIEIGGKTEPFQQKVASMQVEHKSVAQGKKGEEIAIKCDKPCKDGDSVYKVA